MPDQPPAPPPSGAIVSATTPESALLQPRKVNRLSAPRHEDSFVPCLKIKRIRGKELAPEPVMVPMDILANQNREIIVAELARQFLTGVLDDWQDKGTKLTPQELKQTMEAIKIANENCRFAHEGIALPPTPASGGEGKGGVLAKAMEGLGKGLAAGKTPTEEELMKKFKELGRKLNEKEVKEGEAVEVKAEEKK